jgi:mannosyltransferase
MKRSPRPSPGGRWAWRHGLPAAILLIGLALRFHRLGDANLWWDEALAVWGVRKGLTGVTLWTASDVHPPLYFWALWAWAQLVGESEFTMRALSAAAGVLTVAVTYSLGTRAAGRRVGTLAALLTATARFHVWWSQEVRMYVLAGLLGVLSLYLFLRWLDAERARATGRRESPWRLLLLYALTTAGALYTIFLMGALLLVQNLAVAVSLVAWPGEGRRWPALRRWIFAQAGIGLSLAAWLALAWGRMRTWSVAEPFDPRLYAQLYLTLLTTGVSVDIGRYAAAAFYPFLLLGLGGWALLTGRRTVVTLPNVIPGMTLGLAAFLPAVAVYLATIPRGLFYTPHVEARYLLPFAPAFWVLLAWGVVLISTRWRLAGRLAVVTLVALWLAFLPGHYHGRARRDDLRTMVRAIASQAMPGDAVLLSSGGRYPLFLYYYDGLPGARELPPMVKLPPGEGMLKGDQVEEIMAPLAARHGRLWLAEVEAHLTDPEGHARRWLDGYAPEVLALSFGYNALRLYDPAGRAPRLAVGTYTPQYRLDLAIAGGWLWGWELPLPEYAPGDVARVALLWERAPVGPTRVSLRNARGQVLLERSAAAPPGAEARREQFDFAVAAATPAESYDIVLSAGSEERVLGAMRVVGTRPPSPRGSPEVSVGARLGASVTLVGYTLRGSGRDGAAAASPGDSITLDLYWSTAAKLERDYTVFTHLLGAAHNPQTQGPVWGQHDGQPSDGGYPTTQWLVGDTIVDRHTIPVDDAAPAGEYRIEVGLYTVEDGSRLDVWGPRGESWGDRVLLDTTVTVALRQYYNRS